jgi:hypothetical protein
MKGPAVSIRAVPDKLDYWEVVSSHGCCMFEWKRDSAGRGMLRINVDAHDACTREVLDYARRRGYRILWGVSWNDE